MHDSVIKWLERSFTAEQFNGKKVLEVGSYDVNGSPRGLIFDRFKPRSYLGLDIRLGPGVDGIMNASDVGVNYPRHFDVVISTEMLEHAADWRGAVVGMKQALAPGGWLFLTARGPGFGKHDHPHDHWRFTPEDMRRIFSDMPQVVVVNDPQFPGVFVMARRTYGSWKLCDLSDLVVLRAPSR